ncbi:hypothetical protein BUALT_Bualt05G0073800 [Buddleja alternifolia]|uniref:Pectin acetylesterase n=1 Tax=Buddleja alternifolia TaxID=168488 RepID=A0AAV6XIU9_9LAMI|nr:hypothetical protein BUALT_Bualt05G0073800 [Buddleja alternifolia]
MNTQIHCESNDIVNATILKSVAAKGAVCLDGTPPAYFYRKGFGDGANNWMVYLPLICSTLTSIEEVGLGEEGDEEPSLFRKNSKLPRLEVTPVSATLPPATETASREDHALAVALLTSDPDQSTLAENVSTPELPTTVTSSSHEPIPGTDMGIPFTPSLSPPLAESSPIVTVDPNQAPISSPIVTPDLVPPSSIAPITVTPLEAPS